MPKNQQPHDKFIKKVLSDRNVVKQYIQQFVPKAIVENIDFRTLKSSPTTFVDEKLKEHISDIIYECNWKTKKEQPFKIRISFLFEHKSYIPTHPHLQLLRYLLAAWESDEKEKKPLTLTIPIILYHGKKKWKYRPFDEYFNIPHPIFKSYLPHFEYLLTDLSQSSDEEILKLEMGFLINTFLMLKHSREKEYILNNTTTIHVNFEEFVKTEKGRSFIRTAWSYLYETNDFNKKELNLYFLKLNNKIKDIAMSTHDMLIEQGIEQGMEKIIRGIMETQPKLTDEQIAQLTKESVTFIRKVRQSMK